MIKSLQILAPERWETYAFEYNIVDFDYLTEFQCLMYFREPFFSVFLERPSHIEIYVDSQGSPFFLERTPLSQIQSSTA